LAARIEVREYETKEEWLRAFPVLNELRTHLTAETFLEQYEKMRKEGYRLLGLEVDGHVTAVAGINILTNFYNNRFLFVYDLVTTASERSKGYGEQLLHYVHQLAREQGCSYVTLESALHRLEAHRFYEEKMRYSKFCYSFRHTL
jgi:GNAT superfamily N-acetyltransferase